MVEQALARPVVALPGLRPAGAARGAGGVRGLARGRRPRRQRLQRADRGAAAGHGRAGHARADPGADLHALRAADEDPGRRARARAQLGPELEYDCRRSSRRAARGARASVTIVCSPNNPTGGCLEPRGRGARCARERRRPRGDRRGVPRVRGRSRWCRCSPTIRTWSCCAPSRRRWRMAGLRVGYLLASPELVREINKARLPYNLNFFSQMAALAALDEQRAAAGAAWTRLVRDRDELCRPAGARCPASAPIRRARTSSCSSSTDADPEGGVRGDLRARACWSATSARTPRLSRCLRVSGGQRARRTRRSWRRCGTRSRRQRFA